MKNYRETPSTVLSLRGHCTQTTGLFAAGDAPPTLFIPQLPRERREWPQGRPGSQDSEVFIRTRRPIRHLSIQERLMGESGRRDEKKTNSSGPGSGRDQSLTFHFDYFVQGGAEWGSIFAALLCGQPLAHVSG